MFMKLIKEQRHMKETKKWIQGAIEHKGALREKLGAKKGKNIPVSKIEKAEKSKNPTTRKQATLAMTLKKIGRKR
jgi:hypothetical protein